MSKIYIKRKHVYAEKFVSDSIIMVQCEFTTFRDSLNGCG